MSLQYAVERLYDMGWHPQHFCDTEALGDGRRFPTIAQIKRDFAQAGLELSLKHNPKFHCYHAAWQPGKLTAILDDDSGHGGTVVGTSEREAAVYALAQLCAKRSPQQLAAL